MTPEAQSKAARQRNELRAQAETIARLRREKMELLRDLKAAKAENTRADLVPLWCSDMEAAPKDGTRILTFHPADPTAIIERARRDNWVINEWRGRSWYRSLPEQPPVAWMPLTAPPKGETE
jgi:hypothetical protein